MKHLLTFYAILLSCLAPSFATARPTIQFSKATITVSQTAGAISIPFTIVGPLDSHPWAGPLRYITYNLNTQGATATSGVNYEGISKTEYYSDLSTYDGISHSGSISIPIYFTKNTQSTFFNVMISAASDSDLGRANGYQAATIGSQASMTVTISGYVEPKVKITTSTGKPGVVRIEGGVSGVATQDIKKMTATIDGKKMTVYGKTKWYAKRTIKKTGKYVIRVTAYLKNGDSLYSERTLKIQK